MRSQTSKIASRLAKVEGGRSEVKIGDMRQVLRLLKEQHKSARKGNPSFLLQLLREARR
jgi:hypothetical protein